MTFWDYLEEVTPQYDEYFPVTPQRVIAWESDKPQRIIFTADGKPLVISDSDSPTVYFTLNFTNKQAIKAHLIIDWYHNASKANGRARSFKFRNLSEDPVRDYVVRFTGPLPGNVYSWGQHEIMSIKLLVEGRAAMEEGGGSYERTWADGEDRSWADGEDRERADS
jgi:hypothetical protein